MSKPVPPRDSGATSVEFALVLPLFLTFIGAILVFGLLMAYSGMAEYAARIGLRKAEIRTSQGYPNEMQVKQTITTTLGGLLPSPNNAPGTLLGTDPGDAPVGQGDRLTVSVTYTLPAIDGAIALVPDEGLRDAFRKLVTVTRTATGRYE